MQASSSVAWLRRVRLTAIILYIIKHSVITFFFFFFIVQYRTPSSKPPETQTLNAHRTQITEYYTCSTRARCIKYYIHRYTIIIRRVSPERPQCLSLPGLMAILSTQCSSSSRVFIYNHLTSGATHGRGSLDIRPKKKKKKL